jgi:hypothetical protein
MFESTAIVNVVAIRHTSVAKVPEYRQSEEQQMLNRRIFANFPSAFAFHIGVPSIEALITP